MNTSIQDEIKRCNREIAQIEAALLAGHPDVAGLCLALSDWSAEIRILNAELAGRQDAAEDKKSRRPEGQRLGTTGPHLFPEPVDPVPGVGLRTLDLEAHLLAQGSAQKPADGMRLPAGGFHELSERRAFLPPEQGQNLGFLAPSRGVFASFARVGLVSFFGLALPPLAVGGPLGGGPSPGGPLFWGGGRAAGGGAVPPGGGGVGVLGF